MTNNGPSSTRFLPQFLAHPRVVGAVSSSSQRLARQMVEWIENKFAEHGVEKVVPDAETLGHAYRNLAARHKLEQIVDEHRREISEEFESLDVPAEIRDRVEESLRENPALSWTTALDRITRSKT